MNPASAPSPSDARQSLCADGNNLAACRALLLGRALPYLEAALAAQGDAPDRELIALQHQIAEHLGPGGVDPSAALHVAAPLFGAPCPVEGLALLVTLLRQGRELVLTYGVSIEQEPVAERYAAAVDRCLACFPVKP